MRGASSGGVTGLVLESSPPLRRNQMATLATSLTAAAAFLGGAFWFCKAAAIVAGLPQPRLLFEAAPLLFGLALLVPSLRMAPGLARFVALGALALALPAGAWGVAAELLWGNPGAALGVAVLGSHLALYLFARYVPDRLGQGVALSVLPAMAVGGALSLLHEALLEVPILLLGAAWMVLPRHLAGSQHGEAVK
jgi:hypothetical protein